MIQEVFNYLSEHWQEIAIGAGGVFIASQWYQWSMGRPARMAIDDQARDPDLYPGLYESEDWKKALLHIRQDIRLQIYTTAACALATHTLLAGILGFLIGTKP